MGQNVYFKGSLSFQGFDTTARFTPGFTGSWVSVWVESDMPRLVEERPGCWCWRTSSSSCRSFCGLHCLVMTKGSLGEAKKLSWRGKKTYKTHKVLGCFLGHFLLQQIRPPPVHLRFTNLLPCLQKSRL